MFRSKTTNKLTVGDSESAIFSRFSFALLFLIAVTQEQDSN